MKFPASIQERLGQREEAGALRKLSISTGIDFSSNDYLGFNRNPLIAERALQLMEVPAHKKNGSGASRLIAGHTALFEECEAMLAVYHRSDAALIFNSGYDANLGLFACIATRNDTIIYDYLSHASIRDGIRLSQAKAFSFHHNDLADLENKLSKTQGNVFVAVEALYSMDGDEAPLTDLVEICEKHGAFLIVDEAHSNGIYGNGRGLVCQHGLENKVFARLNTFGKALGCHGAAWLGSNDLKKFLINFSRPFIYTTALPSHSICTILAAYEQLNQAGPLIDRLNQNIRLFKKLLESGPELTNKYLLPSDSPIQGWLVPGNRNVVNIATTIQESGIDVRPIRYPTVPEGSERLRIIIHSFNTEEEIEKLCSTLLTSIPLV